MDSVELQTLKTNTSEIELALKDNFKPIIVELRNQGLIKSGTYERVKDPQFQLTQEDRAGDLVRSIENAVELSLENYHKFVRILSGNIAYKDIVMKLHSTYCGK